MTNPAKTEDEEFNRQRALLFSEIGNPGSGYARYAAAMYFHKLGLISFDLLEIFRRCCKFDNENPIDLAIHEGIETVSESEISITRVQ